MKRFSLLGLLALAACGSDPEEAPIGNGLLVSIDTTIPEALSCYGNPVRTTPNIDRIAAEGITYTNARTVTPITAPAHASMLTGLYPVRHGLRMNGSMKLPESASTLAERALAKGAQTAAFVAAVVLRHDFGLDQGFQRYDDGSNLGTGDRRAKEITDRALDWLERRQPGLPFFLWVHYFDPHQPYVAEEEYVSRAGGNPYLGEVAYMDEHMGRLFDALREDGSIDDTLIVIVADHGEGLGRHGELTHAEMIYDTTLAVPLIVRHPDGFQAGMRDGAVTSVVDVFTTMNAALGLGVPGDVDGESLYRTEIRPDRGVYFESYFGFLSFGWSHLVGWADAEGKYVHSSRPEFYAVEQDPQEHDDIAASLAGDRLEAYRRGIRTIAARDRLGFAALEGDQSALQEQIRMLGYAGVGSETFALPEPLDETQRASPHDRAAVSRGYLEARAAIAGGDYPHAEELLRKALTEDPSNHTIQDKLGNLLMRVERWDEAIECFEKALAERSDEWVTPWLRVAACHDEMGRPLKAIEAYRRAFVHGVGPAEDRKRFVGLLRAAGLGDEADGVEAGE